MKKEAMRQKLLNRIAALLGTPVKAIRKALRGYEEEVNAGGDLSDAKLIKLVKRLMEQAVKDEIAADGKVSKVFVRELFKWRDKYSATRIKKVDWKIGSKAPKEVGIRKIKEVGKVVKSGVSKGQYRVYVDTLYNQVISGKTASKLKREIRQHRFEKMFLETPVSKLGKLKKYFEGKTLNALKKRKVDKVAKRKIVTMAEARTAAKRLNDKFYRQDVYLEVVRIFGY